jgi:hypothetical protein
MIDRQPPRPHAQAFGTRRPTPTTVSYGTGLTERRGRHSGQIDTKPCGRCDGSVALDPRRMRVSDGRAVIACLSCGMLVSVRRADLYREAPEHGADRRRGRKRRGWWGRKSSDDQAAARAGRPAEGDPGEAPPVAARVRRASGPAQQGEGLVR